MLQFYKDRLCVRVYRDRLQMGKAAAEDIAQAILALCEKKDRINMIFAAAPSQNEVLHALREDVRIPWQKIRAFHMDEYIGLRADAPQGFGNFLRKNLFGQVPLYKVHYIDCTASDPQKECERYAELLRQYPPDIVVLGIGENGHIAFNDPAVADFRDPKAVKIVQLDEVCRMQQVNDGCFAALSEVPHCAVTLTVPTLTAAPQMFCVVPAKTKAQAVYRTLNGSVDETCPACILRRKDNSILYLDSDSAALLPETTI